MGICFVLLVAWSCGVSLASTTQPTLTTDSANASCQDSVIADINWDRMNIYNDWSCGHYSCEGWYNNSLSGGRRQMATIDNLPPSCRDALEWNWGFHVFLTEEHPDISTIDESIHILSACAVNDTSMDCLFDVDIMVRKCGNDLIYYLSHVGNVTSYWDTNYCFERIYINPCDEPLSYVSYMHVSEEFIIVDYADYGWHNYIVDGQQYVIPTVDDLQYIDWYNSEFYEDWLHYYYAFYAIKDVNRNYWMDLDESAVPLPNCYVYLHDGMLDDLNFTCWHSYYDIYASKCNDGIRYHYDGYSYPQLLVNANMNRPIVVPEIRHDPITWEFDGTMKNAYKPVLQFRCSFIINETNTYIVNWYLDDELVVRRGPSSEEDELSMDESDLKSTGLGFNIKCGYQLNEETNETLSKNYFAGLKILDDDIRLSKRGSALVRAKLTVPMGCLHPASEETTCTQLLILYDPHTNHDECAGGLSIADAYGQKCSEEIKALKFGETWDPHTIYRFTVTTVEHTYDDKTDFNLRFAVPSSVSHNIWQGYQQDGVKVTVTENATSSNNWSWHSYRNKMCYSRGDPHMKTIDGRWYSQQKEGDYMFYQNTKYQIEVQESTKFCFGDSGAVCECGIAVRAGQDVFMLDRCGSVNYLDFPYCGDGGILDVDVVNDYQYTVTTPIGTKIIIYAWGRFMSTDIILSAKDFGSTGGLCGYFDNDWHNDFILRNGSSTESHQHFAESWRLSDEMNLFKNSDRELDKWSDNNSISCQCTPDGFCEEGQYTGCKKSSSITQTKCRLPGQQSKERARMYKQNETPTNEGIQKRSIDEYISNSTAIKMCNDSVYNTAAVKDFGHMLGDEDPSEVFKQCLFDVLASNDLDFVKLYVNAINNIARNFIELNPVFVANNTQTVEKFFQETCPNNCSSQGDCLVTGKCSCREFYRGPDCSIDLRIPPIVQDIQGGGECDRASGDLCECFIVRTDHVFDGFKFKLNTTRVHFDGKHEQTGYSVNTGNHEDIFTGTVCVPNSRKKRDDQHVSNYVLLYDVALSNDGNTFGTTRSVIVYDSTCHNVVLNGSLVVVNLKTMSEWTNADARITQVSNLIQYRTKSTTSVTVVYLIRGPAINIREFTHIVISEGFCYITGTCFPDGTEDGCRTCKANDLPFEWSLSNCDNNSGLSTAVLIGIIGATVIALVVVIGMILYKTFCGSQKNRVQDMPHHVSSTFDGKGNPVNYNQHFTSN